jgi:hypothetical protein
VDIKTREIKTCRTKPQEGIKTIFGQLRNAHARLSLIEKMQKEDACIINVNCGSIQLREYNLPSLSARAYPAPFRGMLQKQTGFRLSLSARDKTHHDKNDA